jgi:hypothetical protein
VLSLKGWYQDFVPKNLIVLAPAFDDQFLRKGKAVEQAKGQTRAGQTLEPDSAEP